MKMDNIKVGDKLQGHVEEDMEQPFTGTVEKLYTNSVLIDIEQYDPQDNDNVIELNHKIVVNAQNLKKPAKK
ncbi:DUF2187 family protein [Bombilactobacillus folatiphilus]|uniref:DUF2187 family protein n=1 Tax=Bombilactobacillus folatiphilus TaxID=2923362 RepID=A0ABY4P924_9LACO|nr:DUF2187 family protein [Bombilactobacillus folatiphilus]UQS82235.1 DUF2187 family protein [Bombilactobacillus folatiphilus]